MIPPVVFDVDFTLTAQWWNSDDEIPYLASNPIMVNLAKSLAEAGIPIVISTARPERVREQTYQWLDWQGIQPDSCYFRDDDDTRADKAVKFEHASSIVDKYGKPLLWFDDNPDNIRVVRYLGIPAVLVNK